MFPHFDFLGKTVSMYSLIAVLGVLLVFFLFCMEIKRNGYDNTDTVIVLSIAGAGAVIISHLLYGLTNWRDFALLGTAASFSEFLRICISLFSGSVFYGGLLGGSLCGFLAVRRMKLDRRLYCDISAYLIPLFHGIARIGCFFGGCCFGVPSRFGFTAHGNDWVPLLNDVRRFPVQLLESACCFLISGVLFFLYRKKKGQGRLFYLYLMMYAAVRFCDEFLRGDTIRGFLGALSTSQIISIPVFLFGAVFLFLRKRKGNKPLHCT